MTADERTDIAALRETMQFRVESRWMAGDARVALVLLDELDAARARIEYLERSRDNVMAAAERDRADFRAALAGGDA